MMASYPLHFDPILRRYLWGGRRLATLLGKSIGDHATCAESWEVVDHGEDQSRVRNGPLAGMRLTDLVHHYPNELFGRHGRMDRFPLLFKFLDAQENLSVQVHPNNRQAARLDPPDLGKTEAWVVLAADSGSRIYAGLKQGIDRSALIRAMDQGQFEDCLHAFEAQPGDCLFIPAGTVHSLGAGLVVAEIQQASDTTFRLFDWNRVDAQGHSRELHIGQALEVIDFNLGPIGPVVSKATEQAGRERLIACDPFVLDRWHGTASPTGIDPSPTHASAKPVVSADPGLESRPATRQPALGGDNRFHVISVIEGAMELVADHQPDPLRIGSTVLIPAAAGPVRFVPNPTTQFLDCWLPD